MINFQPSWPPENVTPSTSPHPTTCIDDSLFRHSNKVFLSDLFLSHATFHDRLSCFVGKADGSLDRRLWSHSRCTEEKWCQADDRLSSPSRAGHAGCHRTCPQRRLRWSTYLFICVHTRPQTRESPCETRWVTLVWFRGWSLWSCV